MALANYLPLVVAVAAFLPALLAPLSARAERIVTRFAMVLFGDYVSDTGRKRARRRQMLRAAHMPTTFRVYAAKTALYAALAALAGGVLATYVIWAILRLLALDPETLRAVLPDRLSVLATFGGVTTVPLEQLFGLLLIAGLTLGTAGGVLTYWARWWFPRHRAEQRAERIDASMPQTVAFVYALSRSGMAFPKVLRILSDNRRVYGAAADEVQVAVRNMDMFGMDMISAIKTMSRRTPSENFREFGENLTGVLQSGRSLSEFLRQQYEEYREEAEAQQEQLLNLLATMAEAYVTVLVAGPLFLITILVIIGITVNDTLPVLQLLAYFLLPLANLGFILYLDTVMASMTGATTPEKIESALSDLSGIRRVEGPRPRTDGGRGPTEGRTADPNVERLRAYQRFRWVRTRLGQPLQTVLDRPVALLWVTVPLAVAVTAWRLPQAVAAGGLTPAAVDDLLIQAGLFVIGTFALAYEVHKRRIEAIEASIPDFLDRLASVNEAGMTVVESLNRVRTSELGALNRELDRVWADIQWGADVETALRRFEARMRTPTVSRVVTLTTKAMNASGNLGTVLRISAAQAKADRRLKRERRQEMLTYLVVVYVSFGVFLVIIAALNNVLIPNLPEGSVVPNATSDRAGNIGAIQTVSNLGSIDEGAYTLVFFHTTLIQGVLSGMVAGQMSGGDVRDGAKHAAILLALAYAAFLVIL
ncbi:type II secretion protein F [Halostella sp. JP-L12]|uniref:type II secretion system F family protein n=1 Tax=Halostella TaxID=1843185 RepID=UPI000EF847C9|nr:MULTISPECIES: type II secretion system F family protein [Halostella]NHN48541.1 type II secretion protein F [Halostella sp. JP-L12]